MCLTLNTWENDGSFLFFTYGGPDDKPNVYQKKAWQVENKVVDKKPMEICLDVRNKSYTFALYRFRNGATSPLIDIRVDGNNDDTDVTSLDLGISGAEECKTDLCLKILKTVAE